MSEVSKLHSELAAIIDRALASPYGVPYDESHAAREALKGLVEQLEAARRWHTEVCACGDFEDHLASYPASVPNTGTKPS